MLGVAVLRSPRYTGRKDTAGGGLGRAKSFLMYKLDSGPRATSQWGKVLYTSYASEE